MKTATLKKVDSSEVVPKASLPKLTILKWWLGDSGKDSLTLEAQIPCGLFESIWFINSFKFAKK